MGDADGLRQRGGEKGSRGRRAGGGAPVWLCARAGRRGSWAASPRPSRGSCAPGPSHRPCGVSPHPGNPLPWASELLTTSPTHMDLSFLPRTFSCINATETTRQGVCVHVCGVRCTHVCPDAIPVLVSGELRVRVLRTPSIYLFQRRSFGVRCTSTSWASRRADPQSAGPRVRTSMQSVGLRGPSRWPWRGRGPPWWRCRGASPPPPASAHVRACSQQGPRPPVRTEASSGPARWPRSYQMCRNCRAGLRAFRRNHGVKSPLIAENSWWGERARLAKAKRRLS